MERTRRPIKSLEVKKMPVEIESQVQLAKQFIKKDRWLIIGLIAVLVLFIVLIGVVYPTEGEGAVFDEILENPLYEALLGPALASLGSLEGWLASLWLSWTWWVGLPLAIYLSLRIFAVEISQGTADNLFVAPVSRKEVILTRYFTSCLVLLIVPVSSFAGILGTYLYFGKQFPLEEALGIAVVDYLFIVAALSITVLVSIVLVEMGKTLIMVGGFYLISYFGQTLGSISEDLQLLRDFSIFQTRPIMEIFVFSATDKILPSAVLLVVITIVTLLASLIIVEKVEIKTG